MADVSYNTEQICRMIDESEAAGAKVVAFPELCVTGYTCGDLFSQEILLQEALQGLRQIVAHTEKKDGLYFVGVPVSLEGKLYNTAAQSTEEGC